LDGAETCALRKIKEKYLENIEMWRWSRKEISWIDRVKNEAVLHRVKEKKEHPTNNKTKGG
jgi:hypothetical protein